MNDSVEAGSTSSQPLLSRSWLAWSFSFLFLLLLVATAALLWRVLMNVEAIRVGLLEASLEERQSPGGPSTMEPSNSASEIRNTEFRDLLVQAISKLPDHDATIKTEEIPQTWDYLIMDCHKVDGTYRPAYVDNKAVSNWKERSVVAEARKLGAEGWELVGISHNTNDLEVWIFKRRRG